ncbi:CBS domain-containing protein [Gammaproteobacteria bacterium]|nr:CBS domain-containing protein [Gammaproteobacteria bacterium]
MTNTENTKDQPPSSLLNKLKRFFTIKPSSLDDVSLLLKDALSSRLIDKEAQFIAERAIRLGDTTVKEIMIPRVEMVTLTSEEEPNALITRIIESGHSRYPVLGATKNEVRGILLVKDLLTILNKDLETFQLNNFIRDIKIVPESKKADSLLEEFKKDRSHMAIVIDEYGTISGLVTIEDILEELVGEIEDEHDAEDLDGLIQVSEFEYIADATLELSIFEEKFEKDFGDIDAETLAGLFISKLGLLPKVGDKIDLDNMILSITAADKRKVKKIGITIKTNR